jgi:hypothetical protein
MQYTQMGHNTTGWIGTFFAKLYNILRWAIVPPDRPDTTSKLTGRAWAAARRPIWHGTVR